MRTLLAAAMLICVSTIALASQPVSKVQLPCDSKDQTLSPTGAQAVVACKDHSLHLVDIPSGRDRVLLSDERPASTYAFSPDGKTLALGFKDGAVQVIATTTASQAKEWKGDSHRIDLLYFLPDNNQLFVGPVDSAGTVWDISGAPALRARMPMSFGGVTTCAASPDGRQFALAGDDTVIRWYETSGWQKTREYSGFLLETFALVFTPDSKQLLAGGADARITIFDAASGKLVRQLRPENGSSVADIKFLSNGQRTTALYLDNAGEKPPHVLLWDMETGRSAPLKMESPPTCGGVVAGNLWICATDNRTMTVSQYE